MIYVTETQLYNCRKSSHGHGIKEWAWLWSNKTLFIKIGCHLVASWWLLDYSCKTRYRVNWTRRKLTFCWEPSIYLFCAMPYARSFLYMLSFILSFVMATWWDRYYYAHLKVKLRLREIQWRFRWTAGIWTLPCDSKMRALNYYPGWFIKQLPVYIKWKKIF